MLEDKILNAIAQLNLDLTGKVVLTEAATGAYAVTPVVAAIAGAKVFAYGKATKYGNLAQIRQEIGDLEQKFGQQQLDLHIIDQLSPAIISQADIITNSGHLRPLDEKMLSHTHPGVVIPLMYESWEFRSTDVDAGYCKQNAIMLAGTNEQHTKVGVFDYLPEMVIKMILDAGLCLTNNKFILVCNNDFGSYIANVLGPICGAFGVCDMSENKKKYDLKNIDWIGNFPDVSIPEDYRNCTAIIWATSPPTKEWMGHEKPIDMADFTEKIDHPTILRFLGDLDESQLTPNFDLYPSRVASGHMGILPSALGYDPIIRLQTAGLKVGEMLIAGQKMLDGERLVQHL